jgi:hypothetical protein
VIPLLLLVLAPRCADSFHLRYEAARAGLPPKRVEAVAYAESACNLDPRLLGHRCRATPRTCDRGRFQIRPATARSRCPDLNTRTYKGNVACALRMLAQDTRAVGLTDATIRQNGKGEAALAYLRRVLKIEEGL